MNWLKLDNRIFEHPKVLSVAPLARLLYIAGLCAADANNTDGYLSRPVVLRAAFDLGDVDLLAAELVTAKLWISVPTGWQIHDYTSVQRTAAEKTLLSEKRTAAGRKGGSKTQANDEANIKQIGSKQLSKSEAETDLETEVLKLTNNNNFTRIVIHRPDVVVRAASLYAQIEAQRSTKPIRSMSRWLEATTRNILDEHGDKLEAALAANPNATPQVLLYATTDIDEWAIADLQATGGYL